MSSDPYRKIGRGGAGNYHSSSEITNISKDLEAQSSAATPNSAIDRSQQPEYAHVGRGGAGNWHKPADVPPEESPKAAISSTNPTASNPSYSGRGGAGNYKPTADKPTEEQQAAEKQRLAKEEELIRDVEHGIRPPEKAHLGRIIEK